MFNTATPEELLDCTHSKAHNFKMDWERGTMQIDVELPYYVCVWGGGGGGTPVGHSGTSVSLLMIAACCPCGVHSPALTGVTFGCFQILNLQLLTAEHCIAWQELTPRPAPPHISKPPPH